MTVSDHYVDKLINVNMLVVMLLLIENILVSIGNYPYCITHISPHLINSSLFFIAVMNVPEFKFTYA